MSRTLDPGETQWRQNSQPPIYPWDEWLDGRARVLYPGLDWFGGLPAFRTLCYRMGREFGYRVRTRLTHEGLHVQALALDGSELPSSPGSGD
jgi:hypothetical protein